MFWLLILTIRTTGEIKEFKSSLTRSLVCFNHMYEGQIETFLQNPITPFLDDFENYGNLLLGLVGSKY